MVDSPTGKKTILNVVWFYAITDLMQAVFPMMY
jgi:hypothetical protein